MFPISFKKIFSISALLLLVPLSIHSLAFESDAGEEITINEPADNLHVAGENVTINQPITRDLIAAGNQVDVNASIERNANIAGNEITINESVGGTARLAGNRITINGDIEEDLVVFASSVTINEATIGGDLIVFAEKIALQDSTVTGDLKASFERSTGDSLEDQVQGTVDINQSESKDLEFEADGKDAAAFFTGAKLYTQLGTIVFLLIISLLLAKRNRLAIHSIAGANILKQFAVGAVITIVLPIIAIPLVFVFPTIILPLLGLIPLLLAIFSVFVPIYVANLVRNLFNLKFAILPLVWITYFLIVIMEFIPGLNFLVGLLYSLVILATFGFLASRLYLAVTTYLTPRLIDDSEK